MEITSRMTKDEIVEHLRKIVANFGGGENDFGTETVRVILVSGANELLNQIRLAFLVKSRGGTGSDGIKWAPLKPSTIANRRTGPGELKAAGITGKRTRGFLTPAEDKEWRKIFVRVYSSLRLRMGEEAAKGIAAATAWKKLKEQGAKTKLMVLGSRQVDILRDTGELLASLQPGIDAQLSGADGQIVRIGDGAITVGTNKKPWHHRGNGKKLPSRPLWPLDGTVPETWMEAVVDNIQHQLNKYIVAGVI